LWCINVEFAELLFETCIVIEGSLPGRKSVRVDVLECMLFSLLEANTDIVVAFSIRKILVGGWPSTRQKGWRVSECVGGS